MTLKQFVNSNAFSRTILALIILNAVVVGLETYPSIYEPNVSVFRVIDYIFLSIFTIEISIKLFALRRSFFRTGWNVFDFAIVSLSLIFYTTNLVNVLRVLRVFRVFRTISALPSLRRLVNALFFAFPAMGSTLLLMLIIFYIYGIIGTTFFASVSADYFGSLQLSLLTLFQVFTLEAWASEVFRPIFEAYSWSWFYFTSFILTTAFIVANLFFGELVNNAQRLSQKMGEESDEMEQKVHKLQEQLEQMSSQQLQLHHKIDELTALLRTKK